MLQAGSIFPSQAIVRVISKKSDAGNACALQRLVQKKQKLSNVFRTKCFLECDAFSHRFHLRDASTICAAIAGRAAASGSVRPE